MLLLAFDTSTPAVTVALCDDERVLAQSMDVDARRHGELLAPAIARVLAAADAVPRDITAIAVGAGPGPYTGLRVGLVTAATLADALDIPAYPVCSLDVLAAGHDGPVLVATDARRREIYWAAYDEAGARVTGPSVDRPPVVREWLGTHPGFAILGDGALLYADEFPDSAIAEHPRYPAATALAQLVRADASAGTEPEPLTPIYLRRPDATPPGPRKQVTPA
ncbi:MAG: tRNA threonylcarbamoyladenosine biosynthesis protein TsaB [Frankiaceae bacterium]|nr:tRNA threonylcarbamoyladenosine biosynthesis protein TsaB [Frankiaceae bacterium]MDQ1726555.1 tRNA threonylcarbamoyladenosine biosynthesis protein TsaB [Frankiaceae bacterium]